VVKLGATPNLVLESGVVLSPLSPDQVTDLYVDGLNDPEINQFLVGPRSQVQTQETVREFVRMNNEDPASLLFGFFISTVLRGTLRFHGIDGDKAFLGLAIFDRRVWGEGWGTRMILAVTDFGFRELGLGEIRAVIEVENIASQIAFRRAGYKQMQKEDFVENGLIKQIWTCEKAS